ncbi:hypothetical protein [Dactylosporangium sp. NPDC000521]|uniref:hypothetical protein n=1 Tax=Dactylosporangium sp. NPDC000521 TaxID=3363975 RepID=UPI0036C2E097
MYFYYMYFYFCQGRQKHLCDLPYLPTAKLEAAMIDNYATVMLPAELSARIAVRGGDVLNHSTATRGEIRDEVKAQLAKLNTQEDRFLDLVGYYYAATPLSTIRSSVTTSAGPGCATVETTGVG